MQLLPHDTSAPGFIGIVRCKALWATEFVALEDRVEFVYALSAIWEAALAQALPKLPEDLREPAKTSEVLVLSCPNTSMPSGSRWSKVTVTALFTSHLSRKAGTRMKMKKAFCPLACL